MFQTLVSLLIGFMVINVIYLSIMLLYPSAVLKIGKLASDFLERFNI